MMGICDGLEFKVLSSEIVFVEEDKQAVRMSLKRYNGVDCWMVHGVRARTWINMTFVTMSVG